MTHKRIAILTGGGDVPGLNAAIKSFVWRLADEGHEIIGLRLGWSSLLNIVPDPTTDNSAWIVPLNKPATRAIDRTGGTILHTSRLNPSICKAEHVPLHLRDQIRVGLGVINSLWEQKTFKVYWCGNAQGLFTMGLS